MNNDDSFICPKNIIQYTTLFITFDAPTQMSGYHQRGSIIVNFRSKTI